MSGQRNSMDTVDFEKQEKALEDRSIKFKQSSKEKLGLINETVDIYSDGIRMTGTIWKSIKIDKDIRENNATYPAIVLAHGFGGKRYHLDFSYAPRFASAGFIVLTFSYRTWDDSDGMLVPVKRLPRTDGKDANILKNIDVKVVRKMINPEWQLRDITSAIDYCCGIKGVDKSRIGLWGSSFGGGHALAITAKDDRVKACVCQIGSIDTHSNWVNRHPEYRGVQEIRNLATKHAQGKVDPWTVARPVGLDGMPHLPITVLEHTNNTINSIDRIHVPTLILAAEKEELFHNYKNSDLVYEKLKGKVPTELIYLPGTHYDAYGPGFKKGVAEAIKWFQIYIGKPPVPSKL